MVQLLTIAVSASAVGQALKTSTPSPTWVEWLPFIAVLTSVHFLATLLRNIRTASRLVPIRSVNPMMVAERNTIPLRFFGSDSRFSQSLLRLYGRVWLGRGAIKQPFLCDEILFMSHSDIRSSWERPLVAGDRIRVTLAVGESESHAYQSAKRSSSAGELQVVVAFPGAEGERYEDRLRSVWVSASGRPVADGLGVPMDREFEWPIIESAARGARDDEFLSWNEVPPLALWLFSRYQYDTSVCRLPVLDEADIQHFKFPYAFGSTRLKGTFSVLATALVRSLAFLFLVAVSADQSVTGPLRLGAAAILVFWLLKLYRSMLFRRFKIRSPRVSFDDMKVAWHGAARRSLALGDLIRRAELWRRLKYEYGEPAAMRLRGSWIVVVSFVRALWRAGPFGSADIDQSADAVVGEVGEPKGGGDEPTEESAETDACQEGRQAHGRPSPRP